MALAALCLLAGWPLKAQNFNQLEEKTLPVGEFHSVSATDNFEITLERGACSVTVTADQQLSPYVQVYVRSKVLYVTYDEKSVPKDIRKLYKGRNAPTPVFRVAVTLPALSGLYLSENVNVTAKDTFESNRLDLTLADKAQVKNLTVRGTAATVNLRKNTQAVLELQMDSSLEMSTEGNAILKADVQAKDLAVSAAGSSQLSLSARQTGTATLRCAGSSKLAFMGEVDKMDLQAAASADVALNGSAQTFLLKAEKNADVDANAFPVQRLEADMSGSSRAEVNVVETLSATLVGGSALYYSGTPVFRIGKIMKSTLAPYGTSK